MNIGLLAIVLVYYVGALLFVVAVVRLHDQLKYTEVTEECIQAYREGRRIATDGGEKEETPALPSTDVIEAEKQGWVFDNE